jgi:hypothetical protein
MAVAVAAWQMAAAAGTHPEEGLTATPLLPEDARGCRVQALAGRLASFLQTPAASAVQ